MAVAEYQFQFFDSSGDTLTPAAGVKIKIVSLFVSVAQQGSYWTVDDGTDTIQLTPSDSSNTQAGGLLMAMNDAWGGAVTVGGYGMIPLILDSTLSLNQGKTFDAGKACMAQWVVIEE